MPRHEVKRKKERFSLAIPHEVGQGHLLKPGKRQNKKKEKEEEEEEEWDWKINWETFQTELRVKPEIFAKWSDGIDFKSQFLDYSLHH